MTPETARDRLTARRDEITASLAAIEDQLDDPMPKDWEDAASERQGDEVLQALGAAEQAELRRIDAALARIEAGEWGACVQCGEDIAAGRLEALPDAALCTACAGRAEA